MSTGEKVFARQKELGIVPADAELSRHDPDVKPWSECTPDERRVFARMMEVYAGFLEHTDYHIGRLLDFLKRIGEFDNTLIIAVSDNGASSEGGPNCMTNINLWHNTLQKQRRFTAAARRYLQQHPAAARAPCRFDVVAITGEQVDWLKGAFAATG